MNNWRYISICICICLSFVVRCRLNYFALALELCAPEVKATNTHTLFATHTLVKLIKHTREHTLDSCLCERVCVCVCSQCAASCRLHMASVNYFCIIYSGSLTHTHTQAAHMPALLLQHFISHLAPPPSPPAPSGPLCLLASCAISNHIWAIKI